MYRENKEELEKMLRLIVDEKIGKKSQALVEDGKDEAVNLVDERNPDEDILNL